MKVRKMWVLEDTAEKVAAYRFLESSKCSYLFSIGEEVPDPHPKRLSETFPNKGGHYLQSRMNEKGQIVYFVYARDRGPISYETPTEGILGQPMIYSKPPSECKNRKTKSPSLCIGSVSCESKLIKIFADVVCNTGSDGKCPSAKTCALASNFTRLVGNESAYDRKKDIFLSQKPRGGDLVPPSEESSEEEIVK
ncbi:MAG: hypothetical protein AB7F86_06830 [Bdellovibrionales bacterium]